MVNFEEKFNDLIQKKLSMTFQNRILSKLIMIIGMKFHTKSLKNVMKKLILKK